MKKLIILTALAVTLATTENSQAATIWTSAFPDWDGTETGDITLSGQTVTVDGATFTFDLLLDGTLGDGTDGVKTHAANDAILMRNGGTNTQTIVFTVQNVSETTATGKTLVYDLLDSVEVSNFGTGKEFTAGGATYAGDNAQKNRTISLDIFPVTDYTIEATAGSNWRIESVDLQFSTTPVPEPSTTALIGLAGVALILRRRK